MASVSTTEPAVAGPDRPAATFAPSGQGRAPSRARGRGWSLAAWLIALLMMAPVLALGGLAALGSGGLWSHLAANVLAHALGQTIQLLVGVGLLTGLVGTLAAWLVSAHDFRGRRFLEWALLLPLAVPTYIVAYAYLDLLHPVGPVQSALRDLLGYASPRDFRLPDLRNMPGAILLLSLVLYPYVYLPVRAMFVMQAANLIEVSRTLGTSRRQIFWRVALPSARPAIAVGVSLALMETLNDIGASQFLGVRSLTISIYTTWVTRSDLPGAAQIALALLLLVLALIVLERWARRQRRYSLSAQRARALAPRRLSGPRGALAFALGILPILFGFVFPAAYLALAAWRRLEHAGLSQRLLREAGNSLLISLLATAVVVLAGLVLVAAARFAPRRGVAAALRLSTLGYAMPGTVLALGVLTLAAGFDRWFSGQAQALLARPVGLLLIGSGLALGYAYVARFLAISVGSFEAGMARLPRSYDHAARTLGRGSLNTLWHVHLPLSKTALAAGALLVFVDSMKELSATLLLRPVGVETLATHLYGEAVRGTYEDASLAALAIVLVGLLPVMLLARVGGRGAVAE